MLLIIVLGLIANLALVSGDCLNGTSTLNDLDWSRFTGAWNFLLHKSHEFESNFDCVVVTYGSPEGNSSNITASGYDKSEKRYRSHSGTITNRNSTGYYEVIHEMSLWIGKVYVMACDYDRYCILMHCFHGPHNSYYALYRSNPPDEATVNDVKRWFDNNNIDRSQLVEWSSNHCQQPETSTAAGSPA